MGTGIAGVGRSWKDTNRRAKQVGRGASRLAADDLPRKTLEEAIRVADCLHSQFAGHPTGWNDLADAFVGILKEEGEKRIIVLGADSVVPETNDDTTR
jgi:hypothetical protein